ncbi:hypothetical protein LP416_07850 [Polaromonas sp. P2-4]|nr:hypothetical protein LP416_07850 [Polaromonas sp. P2-4]
MMDAIFTPPLQLHKAVLVGRLQCLAWLQRHRTAGTPWIALDDTQACFSNGSTQVMIVDGAFGFLPEHEDELRGRLDELEWPQNELELRNAYDSKRSNRPLH